MYLEFRFLAWGDPAPLPCSCPCCGLRASSPWSQSSLAPGPSTLSYLPCMEPRHVMGTFPPLLKRWTKSDLPSVPGVGLRLKRLFWRLFLGDASLASPTCLSPSPLSLSCFFSIKHLYRLSKEASLPLKRGDFSSYHSVSVHCCHASLEATSQPWGPLF